MAGKRTWSLQAWMTPVVDDHPDPDRKKRWLYRVLRRGHWRGAPRATDETGFARTWDEGIEAVHMVDPQIPEDAAEWSQDSVGDYVWSRWWVE